MIRGLVPHSPRSPFFRERPLGKRRLARAMALGFASSLLIGCVDSSTTGIDDITDTDPPDVDPIAYPLAMALSENKADHEEAEDYTGNDPDVVAITFEGSSISVQGTGAEVEGNLVTVTAPGTYRLTGTLMDGQVIVDSEDDGTVRLILNGTDLSSSTGAPIAVLGADKTVIVLAAGTSNHLSDAAEYVFPDPEEDEPNAALFSKDDMTLAGSGSLTVDAHYNDGISSKDGLLIASGHITVNAVDDGLRGKDYLVVKGGEITVNSGGDGLKSDNDDDEDCGYVYLADGVLDISAMGDGIQAETDVLVGGGEISVSSGGGSSKVISEDDSAKGLKAGVLLVFENGSGTIDSADDAVHSNAHLVINGGTLDLLTGDDGIHADSTLGINGGQISIGESFEGIESQGVVIAGGDIRIVSSDDAINGAGDEARPGAGNNYLHILGGRIAIEALGDGLDVNGSIVMTDGEVIIHGPIRDDNSAIDYDRSFQMTGGFLVGAGSARMAQAPGSSSSQYALLFISNSAAAAGTLFHLQIKAGGDILTFAPSKRYQSIAFSSPDLEKGVTYQVYLGGTSTGTVSDGLYQGGTYTGGTKATEFKVSGVVTAVGF